MAPERQQPDVVHYVTVRDAAERLGTTERTIRRWITQKRLRFIQDESKFVRVNLADIEQIRGNPGMSMKPTSKSMGSGAICIVRSTTMAI
jgi:excisionase family DNA binding protein